MKFTRLWTIALVAGVGLLLSQPIGVEAAIPESINYQGFLTELAGTPVDADMSVTFSIYTVESGGVAIWSDTAVVQVMNGLFNVELGSDANPFPEDLFETPLWLGVQVQGDLEMAPRRPLTSAAFSFAAKGADALGGRSASLVINGICSLYSLTDNLGSLPELCGGCFTNVDCQDGNECTINTCDNPGTSDAACSLITVADGTPCDSGLGECIAGTCVPIGECTPGQTEDQPCGASDIGICRFGVQTRTCDPTGFWGTFGPCIGSVDPSPDVCDFLDNDCDGSTDEDFLELGEFCSVGVGECQAFGQTVCTPDGSTTQCDAIPGQPVPELCDGLDNDCDGLPDQGFPVGDTCVVGTGDCQATGSRVCTPDGSTTQCDGTPGDPAPELCDFVDNDCDGSTDEDFPQLGEVCSAGLGECMANGQIICTLDGIGVDCDAIPGQAVPELCDGLDNDCDGLPDQGFPVGDTCVVGTGDCHATGSRVCTPDGSTTQCDAIPGDPVPELCDSVDNDCDGSTDEDFLELGEFCSAGLGECMANGQIICTLDGIGVDCDAIPGQPVPELCDGLDNDCDGLPDQGFPVGDTCVVGTGDCQATGSRVCTPDGSTTQCDGTPGDPAPELCDFVDNDCDGSTDEDFPQLGEVCSAGLGECMANGQIICTLDGIGVDCDAIPGQPVPELCDGLDNDCDGLPDQGFPVGDTCVVGTGDCQATGSRVCTPDGSTTQCDGTPGDPAPELCDFVDNDCDGSTDEDFPQLGEVCSAGVGECMANGQIICTLDGIGVDCDAIPGDPDPEVCDGLDNDCDGTHDEFPADQSCPTPDNSDPTCIAAECSFICLPGWCDLDLDPINGCESSC